MLNSVKIFGAGSVGNHLANASRQLGYSVTLCDIDSAALERSKTAIYPERYGQWDNQISLCLAADAPARGHDLIIIGTPPESHIELALAALDEQPLAVLIEKPLTTPDLNGLSALQRKGTDLNVPIFVGYDHVVSTSMRDLEVQLEGNSLGDLITLDVEFREHWQGILAAHSWLKGPKESYLGNWQRGGGACGEHSHAINLWQRIAYICKKTRILKVSAQLDYVSRDGLDYDRLCFLYIETECGMKGRIVQDLVTYPSRKQAILQFGSGAARWQCEGAPDGDIVSINNLTEILSQKLIKKSRSDDFIQELIHIDEILSSGKDSPISLKRGMETMLVIAASHKSAKYGKIIEIDYDKGPTLAALTAV